MFAAMPYAVVVGWSYAKLNVRLACPLASDADNASPTTRMLNAVLPMNAFIATPPVVRRDNGASKMKPTSRVPRYSLRWLPAGTTGRQWTRGGRSIEGLAGQVNRSAATGGVRRASSGPWQRAVRRR